MPDGYTADIEDLADIESYLERLDSVFRRGAVKRAVGAACKVVRDAARERCPVKTGNLKRSISYVVREYEEIIVGIVGPKRPDADYGYQVEFGHRVKNFSGGQEIVSARPFLRPAADETDLDQEMAIIAALTADLKDAGALET